MNPVQFPDMRAEVFGAVKALADPAYQQRVWVEKQYPAEGYFDDLTLNVNILFDDTEVLPAPLGRVGSVLYDNEVGPLESLNEVFEPVIDELGNATDDTYLADPRWAAVVEASARVLAVMTGNDRS